PTQPAAGRCAGPARRSPRPPPATPRRRTRPARGGGRPSPARTVAGPSDPPAGARPTASSGTPWGPGRPRGRTQPRGPPGPPSAVSDSSFSSPREERGMSATRGERIARARTGHLLLGNGDDTDTPDGPRVRKRQEAGFLL